MDKQTARREIHNFIIERWSEFCNELIEKGYSDDCVYSESLDVLIDDILIK